MPKSWRQFKSVSRDRPNSSLSCMDYEWRHPPIVEPFLSDAFRMPFGSFGLMRHLLRLLLSGLEDAGSFNPRGVTECNPEMAPCTSWPWQHVICLAS